MPNTNDLTRRFSAIHDQRRFLASFDPEDMDPIQRRQADIAIGRADQALGRLGRRMQAGGRPAAGLQSNSYERSFRNLLSGAGLRPADRRTLEAGTKVALGEYRDQSEGTGSAGGFLVPRSFEGDILKALRYSSAMVNVARLYQTPDGRTRDFPVLAGDAAVTAQNLPENTTASRIDAGFTTLSLGAYTYVTNWVLSNALVSDSGVEIAQAFAEIAAARLSNSLNLAFTSGSGTAEPRGLLTGAVASATEATGHTTTVTAAGLRALMLSVDNAYRKAGGTWMMSPATWDQVVALADTQGSRALIDASAEHGPSIWGYPVEINPDFPALAPSTISVAFGSFQHGYVMRNVSPGPSVLVARETLADRLETLIVCRSRWDGTQGVAGAVKFLSTSAS